MKDKIIKHFKNKYGDKIKFKDRDGYLGKFIKFNKKSVYLDALIFCYHDVETGKFKPNEDFCPCDRCAEFEPKEIEITRKPTTKEKAQQYKETIKIIEELLKECK